MEPKQKGEVFAPCNLIAEKQLEKDGFSALVFNSIVRKARRGEVEAVRWFVDNGYMTVRRGD